MFVLMIPLTISKGSVRLLIERSFVLLELFSFTDNNLDMTFTVFIDFLTDCFFFFCFYGSCHLSFSLNLDVE